MNGSDLEKNRDLNSSKEKTGPANRPARARLRHIDRPSHSQPGPGRRVCRARFARGGPGEEKTGPAKARSAARERPLLTRPGPAGAPAGPGTGPARARPTYVRGPSYIRRLPISGCILRHIESGSENSALSSQRPHGPPMANPTPSIRVAPPDGAGNPIPERFPLGLAQKKPGPLAPARAAGPPKPTRGRADLRVSIAGR